MRLISRAAGLGVTSAMVYQGKTPSGIAGLLYDRKPLSPEQGEAADRTRYPLTPSERGMYLEQKRDPDSTVYNLNVLVKLSGTSLEDARNALQEVLWAHEALHAFYGEENGLPVRIVADRLPEIAVADAADEEETLAAAGAYLSFDDGFAAYDVGIDLLVLRTEGCYFFGSEGGKFVRAVPDLRTVPGTAAPYLKSPEFS